jgi:hypothetical protein
VFSCYFGTSRQGTYILSKLDASYQILNYNIQVGKVAAVEIEVSPWAYEEETRKGMNIV